MARVIKTITENYTVLDADDGGIIIGNSSSSIAITMPSAIGRTTFSLTVMNAGTGTVTVLSQSVAQYEEVSIANSNNAWTYAAGGGGGGATTLAGLSDVSIPSPSSGNVLSYNGSQWVSATPTGGTFDGFVDTVTYYLDYSSGNNTNNGLTAETALKTMNGLNDKIENIKICNSLYVKMNGSFLGGNTLVLENGQYGIVNVTSTISATPAQIGQLSIYSLPTSIYLYDINISDLRPDSSNIMVDLYNCTCEKIVIETPMNLMISTCIIENSSGEAITAERGSCIIDSSIITGSTVAMSASVGATIINAGGNTITGTISTATGGAYRT